MKWSSCCFLSWGRGEVAAQCVVRRDCFLLLCSKLRKWCWMGKANISSWVIPLLSGGQCSSLHCWTPSELQNPCWREGKGQEHLPWQATPLQLSCRKASPVSFAWSSNSSVLMLMSGFPKINSAIPSCAPVGISELTQKRNRSVPAPLCHSSCRLYLAGNMAVPLLCPRRCPDKKGGGEVGGCGSADVSPTACLVFFFFQFGYPALCRRISKVSVPQPLWSLLASEP